MSQTKPPQLLVSYSRVDLEFVLRLVRDLKVEGMPAWLDRVDIRAGANWDREIELAIERSSVMLVVISSNSRKSDHVKNELSLALELGKQIVPVVIEGSGVPLMIARVQREDFTGDYSLALRKLLSRLRAVGRTEALASVSVEEVQRLSASSAKRLASLEEPASARVTATADPRSSASFGPIATESLQRPVKSRGGAAWAVAAACASTLGLASLMGRLDVLPPATYRISALTWLFGSGNSATNEPPQALQAASAALIGAGAATVAAIEGSMHAAVFAAVPQLSAIPVAVVTATVLGEAADTTGAAASGTYSAAPNTSAEAAGAGSAENGGTLGSSAAVADALPSVEAKPAPMSTLTRMPAELQRQWLQAVTPSASGCFYSTLEVKSRRITLVLNRYQDLSRCQGKFIRYTEVLDLDQVSVFEGRRYELSVRPTSVLVMPSGCAFELNTKGFCGRVDWKNAVASNILGPGSEGYFGAPVSTNTPLYATWELARGRLRYMPGSQMATDQEKRSLMNQEWEFVAQ